MSRHLKTVEAPIGERPRILVVGSGWRFTSGISYYTCRLTNALAVSAPTRAILMRRLVPTMLYPGRNRVGQVVNDLSYDPGVEVLDGVDWFWGLSALRARAFIDRTPPDVVILQWWTGAVLHSYLLLAILARRRGARVVMEWHEVQDTGEARIPGVVRYVRAAMRVLLRRVDAHVVHSQYDLDLLRSAYGLNPDDVTIVPHGPYDHVRGADADPVVVPADFAPAAVVSEAVIGDAGAPFQLLYFGIIRPYKGLEDLVEAFGLLNDETRRGLHLTIVGETWEGWNAPLEMIAAGPLRDQITVINRYVSDAEARRHFAAADAVVLPYRRSSSSGPLHIAMSVGLPVVVTSVGGLVEAAGDYEGVVFVPPQDPAALADALRELPERRDERYPDPHSWQASVRAYGRTFERLGLPGLAEPAAHHHSRPDQTSRTGKRSATPA